MGLGEREMKGTRFVKWKAKWFKNLDLMYREEGLITSSYEKEFCNPSKVWINPKDGKKLRVTYYRAYRNDYPFLPKKKIDLAVAMLMLNIEPRVNKGVAEGFILIEGECKKEIKE